jgi:hypothetical protein
MKYLIVGHYMYTIAIWVLFIYSERLGIAWGHRVFFFGLIAAPIIGTLLMMAMESKKNVYLRYLWLVNISALLGIMLISYCVPLT